MGERSLAPPVLGGEQVPCPAQHGECASEALRSAAHIGLGLIILELGWLAARPTK
jgi:hypothetical protein